MGRDRTLDGPYKVTERPPAPTPTQAPQSASALERKWAFIAAVLAADRIDVQKRNALGEWDTSTFGPEEVAFALLGNAVEE